MTIRGLDLASLSLVDALDLAILVEAEAQERYEDFAEQMDLHRTPEAAKFFRYMIENEAKHGQDLKLFRDRRFPETPRTVTPGMLFDVEAPDFDSARAFMTARQAMEAALAAEVKAHRFFEQAVDAVKDPEVRNLFRDLCGEELEHQNLVKAELAKLPPDPPLSDEDFVDEPAAQ